MQARNIRTLSIAHVEVLTTNVGKWQEGIEFLRSFEAM